MGQALKTLNLDLEQVKKDLDIQRPEVDKLVEQAESVVIENDSAEQDAVALDVSLNEINKELEKKRKEIVEAPYKFFKDVNAYCKVMTEAIGKARDIIKGKLKQYIAKKRLAEAKQQALINQKTEELQREIKAQTPAGMAVPMVAPIQAPVKTVTRTADRSASAYTKKIWKAEITNPALVPREYCEPSKDLIIKAAKMGVRFIPGARIWEDEDIVTRQN
jgi:hypothetical protein